MLKEGVDRSNDLLPDWQWWIVGDLAGRVDCFSVDELVSAEQLIIEHMEFFVLRDRYRSRGLPSFAESPRSSPRWDGLP
jgi:hypothetical protein